MIFSENRLASRLPGDMLFGISFSASEHVSFDRKLSVCGNSRSKLALWLMGANTVRTVGIRDIAIEVPLRCAVSFSGWIFASIEFFVPFYATRERSD